jgi:hypothetical protein
MTHSPTDPYEQLTYGSGLACLTANSSSEACVPATTDQHVPAEQHHAEARHHRQVSGDRVLPIVVRHFLQRLLGLPLIRRHFRR